VAQAGVQTLFLEQYLDQPIERAISTALKEADVLPLNYTRGSPIIFQWASSSVS
jgi:hypothetical protein